LIEIDRAIAWAEHALAGRGVRIIAPPETVRVRPWSVVARLATSAGALYVKAAGPAGAHEPALLKFLSSLWPQCMPVVLCADEARGWVVIRDGGAQLREIIRADRDLRHWETLLPLYAQIQIALADRCDELLTLGVPDQKLQRLPSLFAELLEDQQALHLDQPGGLPSENHVRLTALSPQVALLCERLGECGIPQSLHHGDLHDGNIFVSANDGRYGFFDWGDSCVAHPLFSFRVVLACLERTLELSGDGPQIERLRESYLEPFRQFASADALCMALRVARTLANIDGALTWRRSLAHVRPGEREAYREPIPRLLEEFLLHV
jgi:hypothetical protein